MMELNTSHRVLALALLAVALTACKREEPAPTDTPQADVAAQTATDANAATAEPAKIPGTDAIAVTENTTAEAGTQASTETVGGVDAKDFAGRFGAEGAAVELKSNGTYAMTVRAASANADLQSTGTWTTQADGKELLLDSDDKSEPDRLYAVRSKDELAASGGGQILRREVAR